MIQVIFDAPLLWNNETCLAQGKENTHKHKPIWGIVQGLGGWQACVYLFFGGSLLMGEKRKHINKIPENPGTIPCIFYLCVFLLGGFFAPNSRLSGEWLVIH